MYRRPGRLFSTKHSDSGAARLAWLRMAYQRALSPSPPPRQNRQNRKAWAHEVSVCAGIGCGYTLILLFIIHWRSADDNTAVPGSKAGHAGAAAKSGATTSPAN